MTPAVLQDGEVQYYASPVLVKNNQYYATLTNQRLIFEGAVTREFKVISIQAVYPELIENGEPGLKLIISTPKGQRDMILGFPVDSMFKAGEQQAWIDAVNKAVGEKPFASGTFAGVSREAPLGEVHSHEIRFNSSNDGDAYGVPAAGIRAHAKDAAASQTAVSVMQTETSVAAPDYSAEAKAAGVELIRGESVVISTAGVRVKHTFYTIYLTNLRLILQNNLGKIGREFALAELMDAASLESDSGEPEIAVSVGMQSGLKQMIIVYPTESARNAWMQQLQNRLPRKNVSNSTVSAQVGTAAAARVGTFVPATNERILVSTPDVRIKNRPVVVHLTTTRFVVDSVNGVVGEFAVTSLSRAVRMASEIGEPGIALKIKSAKGDRDMHLVFPSLNDREAWIDALQSMIPDEEDTGVYGAVSPSPYSVTTVRPRAAENTQTMKCPSCGAVNPASETNCALCGSSLHPARPYAEEIEEPVSRKKRTHRRKEPVEEDDDESWPPKGYREKKSRVRHSREKHDSYDSGKERREYTGGVIGFISRPRDAFQYYAHERPGAAFPAFLLTGAIWAVLTTLLLVYVLPNIFAFDAGRFPILASLQDNILLLIIFIVILWLIWLVAVLLHAVITSVVAHLFEPSVKISEVLAMTMRCSLTFAVVGWIPLIGMFAASIWMAVETWFGLRITQDTSGFGAAAAAFVGMIVVYVALFAIGGGFA
ncbi:MAG TPA: Yip1 family protein [Methanocorpusculum sp.]|nr:Yip1 family protein [Methanocorpusculum sp.]